MLDVDQDNFRMNKMMIYLPKLMQGMVRIKHLILFVKNSNNIVTIFFNNIKSIQRVINENKIKIIMIMQK
jgi:hypothetical protein